MSGGSSSFEIRRIRFVYKDTEQEGTLISEHLGNYTIKLGNGYNIVAPSGEVKILESSPLPGPQSSGGEAEAIIGNGPNRVTIVATGGTISSRVDYSTGAVTPSNDIGFLKSTVSDLERRFTVDLESRDNILSENMTPAKWIKIAGWIRESLKKSHGVIVSHGTDTLSYTASAMSFMFERQTGPIIFVGSQRSPDRPSSDAFTNIEGAINFASAEIGEVGISMHASESDNRISLIRATRSRKMHSSRRDAFHPMGEKPLAFYSNGSVVIDRMGRPPAEETVLNDRLDPGVGIVYFHPAMTEDDFLQQADGKKAVIVMGTGLGHIADRLIEPVREIVSSGRKVVMTTQCIHGSTNLNVYSTGRKLLDAGVLEVGNVVPEVAYVKAMYVLANHDLSDFDRVMRTNLRGEILKREELE